MSVTKAFYEAVRTNNVRRVRIMLKNSILVDTTFSEYKSMIDIASNLEGLFDEHDGINFNHDKKFWTDEYLSEEMTRLISNFSKERISHLMDVIRFLKPQNTNHQKHNVKSVKNFSRNKKIISGVAIGATVGALLGNEISDDNGVVFALLGAAFGAIVGGNVANRISNGDNENE